MNLQILNYPSFIILCPSLFITAKYNKKPPPPQSPTTSSNLQLGYHIRSKSTCPSFFATKSPPYNIYFHPFSNPHNLRFAHESSLKFFLIHVINYVIKPSPSLSVILAKHQPIVSDVFMALV